MKEHKRIERLMLFSQVAKELNFSRAAESMGISRGHLSEQIKYLERELGTTLLNRSTRQVSLTSAGKQVLACMDTIKSTLSTLERDISHEKNALEGELKITAPLLFAHRFLNDICADFNQHNPEVTFNLNTSYQSHDLNKDDFDIAFRATSNPPLDMVARPVLSYQHIIVTSPTYIEAKGQPQALDELHEHQCITGEHQNSWHFADSKVMVNGWIRQNDNFSILQQVLAGRGIARLPNYFVDKEIENNNLVALFSELPVNNHQIYGINPPKIQQSARLRAFLDYARQCLAQYK